MVTAALDSASASEVTTMQGSSEGSSGASTGVTDPGGTDNPTTRGFGLTFLFINLYTRYFEFFWDAAPKAVFFVILAASFWALGHKAETIWNLGRDRHGDT